MSEETNKEQTETTDVTDEQLDEASGGTFSIAPTFSTNDQVQVNINNNHNVTNVLDEDQVQVNINNNHDVIG